MIAATVQGASSSDTALCALICGLIVFLCIKFFGGNNRTPGSPDAVSPADVEWWL